MSFPGANPSAVLHWRMPQELLDAQDHRSKLTTSLQTKTPLQDPAAKEVKIESDDIQAVRFCCKGWRSKALQVSDVRTNAITCTIDTKFRKPNLVFKHGEEGQQFGTTTYHTLSTKIDLDINGQSVELKPTKTFSSSYTYTSPAFNNTTLSWKCNSGWKNIDYVLLDERALPVARCSAPCFSMDFSGKIEFLESAVTSQQAREEILITVFSLVYLTITTYYAAIATA